jgi:hypothetical protein
MIHSPISVMHAIYVQGISVSAAIVNLFPVKRNIRPEEEKESVRNKVFPRPEPEPAGITHVMTPSRPLQPPDKYHGLEISIGLAITCSEDTAGTRVGECSDLMFSRPFSYICLISSCLQLRDENRGFTTLRKVYLPIGITYIVLMFYGVFGFCELLLLFFFPNFN